MYFNFDTFRTHRKMYSIIVLLGFLGHQIRVISLYLNIRVLLKIIEWMKEAPDRMNKNKLRQTIFSKFIFFIYIFNFHSANYKY